MATYFHVTSAGAGDNSGDTWANAMAFSDWETAVEALTTESDYYYFVKEGTYTLTSDFNPAGDATALLPNHQIGVLAGTTNEGAAIVAADWATGDNRPLLTDGASAYIFHHDDYWVIRNFRMEGSDSLCIGVDTSGIVDNCKVENDGSATKDGFNFNYANGRLINSEAVCTNGIAVNADTSTVIIGCYIHDSVTGISHFAWAGRIINNIVDTCSTAGIAMGNDDNAQIIYGNTIYNCPLGISGSDGDHLTIMNNILTSCSSIGIKFTVLTGINYLDYNNFYNNGATVSNATVGVNTLTANPTFVDAPNGNFSLSSGSGCIGTGFMVTDGS